MPATSQTTLLELQADVWKSRAQAKQKRLERTLAETAASPGEVKRQLDWITQALETVQRGRHELKYQAALLDVYSGHLNALEMSLMAAAEQRTKKP